MRKKIFGVHASSTAWSAESVVPESNITSTKK